MSSTRRPTCKTGMLENLNIFLLGASHGGADDVQHPVPPKVLNPAPADFRMSFHAVSHLLTFKNKDPALIMARLNLRLKQHVALI